MNIASPPDNPLQLATLDARGKAPRQRLTSAADAQNLFEVMRQAALPRQTLAASIKSMFDGGRPYDQSKRRAQADAWRSNFNSLEAASRLEAAKSPFYDLLSSSSQFAECTTDLGPSSTQDVQQGYVDSSTASRIRSESFDRMLRSYASFDDQWEVMLTDFIAFNKGFLWFPTPESWHFKRLHWYRVLFPDGTSTDPDEWECFAIEHNWPPSKLFRMAKNAPKDSGWNLDRTFEAIRWASPDAIARSFTDPMKMEQMFRDSDFYLNSRIGVVKAASVYTREFDGKWSRMMVETTRYSSDPATGGGKASSYVERENKKLAGLQGARPGEGPQPVTSTDWLYNKPRLADRLSEILCPFIFDRNDGSMNELSGLGKRIMSFSQAKDRLLNTTVDNTFMRSGLVLQAQNGMSQQRMAAVQFTGFGSIIAPGFAAQPATYFGDIQGPMVVCADLDNRLDKNTSTYRPTFEKPAGNPETATAASARFSQMTQLGQSAVNRFYHQADPFYDELYRRATLKSLPRDSGDEGIEAALKFQEECAAAGLSAEQCRDRQPGSIKAMRAIGNGSPIQRQQTAGALAGIVPYFGPRGLQQWKVMTVAAYGGESLVKRLLPPEDEAQVPPRDAWDASVENGEMSQGNQPVFAPWQDSQIHATTHLSAAFAAIQSVLQQHADPGIPFTFLQIALPHIQQHIARVPREQIRKELEAAFMKLRQGAQQVMQAAQQHVQQGQQQQALSFEQQLDAQKTQHDIQIKDAVTQARLKQSAEKHQQGMQISQAQAQADMQLKLQAHQVDTAIKTQGAQVNAQVQDAGAASTITANAARTASDIKLAHVKTASDIALDHKKQAAKERADARKAAEKPKSKD